LQAEAIEEVAHVNALSVHFELEQVPEFKKYPSKQVKATLFEEHVAALVPHGEQAPFYGKYPVSQVTAFNPEQVKLLVGHLKHYPFFKR